jgi:hypothetical protein
VLAGDFHPRCDYRPEADVPHYLESFGVAEMQCRDWRQQTVWKQLANSPY